MKRFLALMICACMLLCGCASAQEDAVTGVSVVYKDKDMDFSWQPSEATAITLGAEGVRITQKGTYVLSGTTANGQITVDVGKEDKVRLVLSGVSVHCENAPALYVIQADKVTLTLAEGTENAFSDGAEYALAEGEDEPNAAIFSKEDLVINGNGSLSVSGNYRHGILSKDDLIITGGVIAVTAKEDGIRGRDSVQIASGDISVTAGDDGVKATNDEDTARGFVSLDGGKLSIVSGMDGVQAETVLQMTGGTVTIQSGGGSENASTTRQGDRNERWGGWGSRGQQQRQTTTAEDTPSAKGVKSASDIYVSGGTLSVDSSDDAVHANGSVYLAGGTLALASGDDGVHADDTLSISGGDIGIAKSYEGLEAVKIFIKGGDIDVVSSDDGLNAAGGADGSSLGGRMGRNNFRFQEGSTDCYIQISGGTLFVDASGDGIDSNGALYMSGGYVVIDGPTNSGNGPLDYTTACTVTGGTLIAAGSMGMAQGVDADSTQRALMCSFGSGLSAGSVLTAYDASGNLLVTYTNKKTVAGTLVCCPEMVDGATITVYVNDELLGSTTL